MHSARTAARSRLAGAAYWAMMRRIVLVAGCIDAVWIPMYAALGSPFLAALNVASVGMYALAYWLIGQRRNKLAVTLVWARGAGALGAGLAADWLGERVSLLLAAVHPRHRGGGRPPLGRAAGGRAGGLLPGPARRVREPGPAEPAAALGAAPGQVGEHPADLRHVLRHGLVLPRHRHQGRAAPAASRHHRPAHRPGQPQPVPCARAHRAQPGPRAAANPPR